MKIVCIDNGAKRKLVRMSDEAVSNLIVLIDEGFVEAEIEYANEGGIQYASFEEIFQEYKKNG